MDTKKFLTGTLAGTVASFIIGYLIFGILLHAYFASNTMEGVGKAAPDIMWIVCGHISFAAALTYIFLQLGNVKTLMGGLTAGFIIGLLVSLAFDLIMFGTTNISSSIAPVCVDAVAGGVMWGIGGAAIGWVLGLGGE
jgi:hypothetical protein